MYPKSNFSIRNSKISFLKEIYEKKNKLDLEEITSQSDSNEISDIIVESLLLNIKKQLTDKLK